MSAYLRPSTLGEAAAMRAEHPEFTVLAGGTDLLVSAHHRFSPVGVIDVFGLGDIRGLSRASDGIRIGAATTYAELLASDLCKTSLPAMWAASREVGALQIQARGTVGGNIATSSPVGDTLPVLLALDAEIELVSAARGARRVAYASFCTGYRITELAGDELISAIHIPSRPGLRQFWRKIGTRRAQSISKVMIAAAATVGSGGTIDHLRVGLGAVADRPVRALAVEAAALGRKPGDVDAAVRAALRGEIRPIDDVRSRAGYRLAVAENVVARFFAGLADS